MALNTLAPGFIVLNYIGASNIPHKMTFGILPADLDASPPTIKQKDNTVISVVTGMNSLINILKVLVAATTTFTDFDVWSKPNPEDDPVWKYNGSLNVVGTGAGSAVANSQLLASYRSGAGGVGKVMVMEGNQAVNQVFKPPSYTNSANSGLAAYLIGTGSIIYARDNAFPVAVPRMFTKTNDALRKKTVLNV